MEFQTLGTEKTTANFSKQKRQDVLQFGVHEVSKCVLHVFACLVSLYVDLMQMLKHLSHSYSNTDSISINHTFFCCQR
jgi:hypothetical protein